MISPSFSFVPITVLLFLSCVPTNFAQTNATSLSLRQIAPSSRLQELVDDAVKQTLAKFSTKQLVNTQLAVTLIDLTDGEKPSQGGYRAEEQIYPASVIKLFYLAAAEQWMEEGKLKDSEEVRRAMRDMIVDSLNEATGYVVDCLTDTTSGPELSSADLESWYSKRNAVNRYFTSLGYAHINVNRKPWCEGPYGREMQSVRLHKPNHRNWLTTGATARLLGEIVLGRAVSAERCRQMMELLKRDPFAPGDKNDQAHAYTGQALPAGSKLWSKAGWTSQTRHDAAYVELPTGEKFVLVTFTVDHANEREIIPFLARLIVEGMSKH